MRRYFFPDSKNTRNLRDKKSLILAHGTSRKMAYWKFPKKVDIFSNFSPLKKIEMTKTFLKNPWNQK